MTIHDLIQYHLRESGDSVVRFAQLKLGGVEQRAQAADFTRRRLVQSFVVFLLVVTLFGALAARLEPQTSHTYNHHTYHHQPIVSITGYDKRQVLVKFRF